MFKSCQQEQQEQHVCVKFYLLFPYIASLIPIGPRFFKVITLTPPGRHLSIWSVLTLGQTELSSSTLKSVSLYGPWSQKFCKLIRQWVFLVSDSFDGKNKSWHFYQFIQLIQNQHAFCYQNSIKLKEMNQSLWQSNAAVNLPFSSKALTGICLGKIYVH